MQLVPQDALITLVEHNIVILRTSPMTLKKVKTMVCDMISMECKENSETA